MRRPEALKCPRLGRDQMNEHANFNVPSGETVDLLLQPNVIHYGPLNDASVRDLLRQLDNVRAGSFPLVLELTTEGGDADGARRVALEIRLLQKLQKKRVLFIGKTVVMSAGVTIMAAFPPDCRFLTSDTVLLIHERRMQQTLEVNGPIKANIQIVREILAQLESAEKIERDGFAELSAGSAMTADELYERATTNCYLTAAEALELRLIARIL
jgi:ATP-dependent protease ClpP protease subunit